MAFASKTEASMNDNNDSAIEAAMAVMAAHIAALNAGDEKALAATLHFPITGCPADA